jgi:hypothetical protein
MPMEVYQKSAWLPIQATLREILVNIRHSRDYFQTRGHIREVHLGWILEASSSRTYLRQENGDR